MSEFTGERLIPGEVDADLWNEHISRYAFAASLCSGGERILDAGCGTGYGSSLLSQACGTVLGIDASPDAISYAERRYATAKARFAVGLCEAIPALDASADRIIAFEVIEHLAGWRTFLEECDRVLVPDGVLLVSTPNKTQYSESRGAAGPNPFHVHEFNFDEFAAELERIFSHVRIFGQNHAGSIVFSAMGNTRAAAHLASIRAEPETAGFFVALCSQRELRDTANFVYVPESANLLREREHHIQLLRGELDLKNDALARFEERHSSLVRVHRELEAELKASNSWAESLNHDLAQRGARLVELQSELEESRAWAASLQQELDARSRRVLALQEEIANEQNRAVEAIEGLRAELESRTDWARERDAEVVRMIDLLRGAQQSIEEKTEWGRNLESHLARLQNSRGFRVARALHLGRLLE